MKSKIYSNLLLVIVVILFSSCDKNDYEESQNFIGCWINPVYTSDVDEKTFISFEKTNVLSDDFGIEFLKKGSLIERKISGWCATPPIIYADYSGNWNIENENIIINVAYWGGIENRIWKIIDVTDTTLKIEVVLQEYNN